MQEQKYQVGLTNLVDGFLFSLKAEGRSPRTHQYYRKLLQHFLDYAKEQGWPDDIISVSAENLRQFLSWIANNGLVINALIAEAINSHISAFAWSDVVVSAVVLVGFILHK